MPGKDTAYPSHGGISWPPDDQAGLRLKPSLSTDDKPSLRVSPYSTSTTEGSGLMKYVVASAVAFGCLIGNAGPSFAQPQEAALHLQANVDPFCRVWSENDEQALQFDGDQADLGAVREVCNTAGGYRLKASFTNLSEGSIIAGSDTAVVDPAGTATFAYREARVHNRAWQLISAKRISPDAPVYLRLSISPL
jgi:hypothetical protein